VLLTRKFANTLAIVFQKCQKTRKRNEGEKYSRPLVPLLQVCFSRRPPLRKNCKYSGYIELSTVLQVLGSFSS
jgi:hypothetical protein